MAGVIFIQIDFFFFGFYTSKIIIDDFSSMKFKKKRQIDHPNIYIYIFLILHFHEILQNLTLEIISQ